MTLSVFRQLKFFKATDGGPVSQSRLGLLCARRVSLDAGVLGGDICRDAHSTCQGPVQLLAVTSRAAAARLDGVRSR